MLKCIAVIPARYASTRFPGKPLVEINGKSMIQRVIEQALQAQLLDHVVVATDDERIKKHVLDLGYAVAMTSDQHESGTDRCAEVAKQFPDFDLVINIQGDEPFIQPQQIDDLIHFMKTDANRKIATLYYPIDSHEKIFNPNIVKVVFSQAKALYFSRNPIPFIRDIPTAQWETAHQHFKHIGVYGFDRKTLIEITQLPQGKLESIEKLEQLRWLENGFDIHVLLSQFDSKGIDTPADLKAFLS